MPTDPTYSDQPDLVLTADQVDALLDEPLRGIVRETFASEERAHNNGSGWDRVPPTVLQYLSSQDAPSGVAVVPTGAVNLGNPRQVLEMLVRALQDPSPYPASSLAARFLRSDVTGYLGCAIVFEGYMYPGSREERRALHGEQPLSQVAEAVEIRSVRGVTTEGRRFHLLRTRDVEQTVMMIDPPLGVDSTHPSTAITLAVGRLNAALGSAYANAAI